MIITRYATHKLLDINESVFSQMWKKHQAEKDFYGFFTDDGKVDISDPSFIQKYSDKIIPEELEKIKNKLNKKNNKTPKSKKKKDKKEKLDIPENKTKVKIVKKRGRPPKDKTEKKTVKNEPVKNKESNKPKKPDNENNDEDNEEKTEIKELSKKAAIAKFKKEIFAAEKAEIELKKARAQLAELDTIGRVCIGYLIALHQSILDQPRSFIDELCSGIKAGKSKTDLTDIARIPAMNAISESIELIKKEIAKYKRDIKSENK